MYDYEYELPVLVEVRSIYFECKQLTDGPQGAMSKYLNPTPTMLILFFLFSHKK